MNAMKAFDMSRPNIAAHATGLARAAYEHALQYSGERQTFGKPLHRHQAIQFMLADMKTKIEASRMLTWKSAADGDAGVRNTDPQPTQEIRFRYCNGSCNRCSSSVWWIWLLRGISGCKTDAWAKVMQIYEGSSQVQRMIIGREITKDL